MRANIHFFANEPNLKKPTAFGHESRFQGLNPEKG